MSKSAVFVALTAVSLLAHGVVLGLPWPDPEAVSDIPPPASAEGEGAVMDVAILPSASLEELSSQPETRHPAAADQEPVDQEPPAVEQAPEPPAPERSPQPPPATPERSPQLPVSPPAARPEPPPSTPPEPALPPLPEEPEPEVDPISDLPIADGTAPPLESASASPPTLEERLQDAAAYQYDGRKSLKEAEAYQQASLDWVASDQILPENVDSIELPYQLGATCLDTPPELGLLAVILDETGNFVQGPEVIDSTGYPLLDEQAAAIVIAGDHPFPDRSEPQGYVAYISVQYPAACL